MSFFPGMFKAAEKGIETWLMQINNLGDVVIYKLNADGNPTSMVAGKPSDVIMSPLETIYPVCRLNIVHNPDITWHWGFRTEGVDTWEAVKKSLISKSSSEKRRHNRSIFDQWISHLEPYLTGQYWGAKPDLALTTKAIELDKTQAENDEEDTQ